MEQVEQAEGPLVALAELKQALDDAFDAITKRALDGEIEPSEALRQSRELRASVESAIATARGAAA
jgi:hypothetical protein